MILGKARKSPINVVILKSSISSKTDLPKTALTLPLLYTQQKNIPPLQRYLNHHSLLFPLPVLLSTLATPSSLLLSISFLCSVLK